MADYLAPKDILARLDKWENLQGPAMPMEDDEAVSRLQTAGLSDDERNEKQARLTVQGKKASPRILANYIDLHAVNRIDEANRYIDLSDNFRAGNVRAILQASEIAILNTCDVARRVVTDIEDRKLGDAEEKYRWISSFQQTLHSLSLLAAKMPLSGAGYRIAIADSPTVPSCLGEFKILYRAIEKAGLMKPDRISDYDIHEAGRNITHQAFVDSTYINLWMGQVINIPSIQPEKGEDAKSFYKRFAGTEALDLVVMEVDQKGDNFLRQFRAYHQISEVLVGHANRLIAHSIRTILSPSRNILSAKDNMGTALDMLDIVNQNLVPILRNLSVNKYQDIRGSLGITSGSHSPNIKQGLFAPLYELFTGAVKSYVMDGQPYEEEELAMALQRILADPAKDHATHDAYDLLHQANKLHLAIRTWRDLHMQFVKTQIGLPPHDATPTASISGSPNAMRAAHGMRQGAHGAYDPIIPIFEALLGIDFPIIAPFANVFRDQETRGNFVDDMLVNTAIVVENRSAGVQQRIHGKNV